MCEKLNVAILGVLIVAAVALFVFLISLATDYPWQWVLDLRKVRRDRSNGLLRNRFKNLLEKDFVDSYSYRYCQQENEKAIKEIFSRLEKLESEKK